MTELQLYRWLKATSTEWHWRDNNGKRDVIMFISFYNLNGFCDLMGWKITEEDGLNVVLKDKYICIWMQQVCDYHDITMENVCEKGEEP